MQPEKTDLPPPRPPITNNHHDTYRRDLAEKIYLRRLDDLTRSFNTRWEEHANECVHAADALIKALSKTE